MIDETRKKRDELRRLELADFLKIRRAKIKPIVGHKVSSKWRRTPGLRREEVAEMAGVSTSWYTWLEQGRQIQPSAELLLRLSQVLRLNAFETHHLFDLAGKPLPENFVEPHENIPSTLENLVMNVIQAPAFVMGERMEFLLWNRHYVEQIVDPSTLPKERRTVLDLIFTFDLYKRSHPAWDEHARRIVAEFRHAIGKQAGSPWVHEFVSRLSRESEEFARLWRRHDVEERKNSRTVQIVRDGHAQSYVRSIYVPVETGNLRLVIMTPLQP